MPPRWKGGEIMAGGCGKKAPCGTGKKKTTKKK